jgi:hypothetical protein
LLPTSEDITDQLEGSGNHGNPVILTFDFPGAITLAIAISSLLIVIDLKNKLAWADLLIISITILGSISMLAFLFIESYSGSRNPLIPLWILKTEVGAFCAVQASQDIFYFSSTFISFLIPNSETLSQ